MNIFQQKFSYFVINSWKSLKVIWKIVRAFTTFFSWQHFFKFVRKKVVVFLKIALLVI